MMRLTPTVKHLLILNILFFIGTSIIGNSNFYYEILSLNFVLSDSFGFWQIITHMFMHGSLGHLLLNMLGLWMFGSAVEQSFGQQKFLFFYISCGLGAAILNLLWIYYRFNLGLEVLTSIGYDYDLIINTLREGNYNKSWLKVFGVNEFHQTDLAGYFSAMVGASGAIFGILVAFGMLNPNAELMLIFLPIPIKAKYFVPGIIALNLFSAVSGVSIFSPSNTAYIAHIGGALTGFLIMYFWKKNQFDKYRWN